MCGQNLGSKRSSNVNSESIGAYLEHIFQNCPKLFHLSLLNTLLLSYVADMDLITNKMETRGNFIITEAGISAEFLRNISPRCDNRLEVCIHFCNFFKPNGDKVDNPTILLFDMPMTSAWKVAYSSSEYWCPTPLPTYYLKIEHSGGAGFYVGDTQKVNDCSEEEYEESMNSTSSLYIHICYKFVEMLRPNTPDYNIIIRVDGGCMITERFPIKYLRVMRRNSSLENSSDDEDYEMDQL